MKTLMFSLVAVSLLNVSSFGATSSTSSEKSKMVRLGVQGGVVVSGASTPADITPSNFTGFAAGVNVDVSLASWLSIMPELTVVQRGVDLAKVGNIRVNARYTSLEVPLFVKFKFGESVTPFVIAGPVGTFNVGSSVAAQDGSGAGAIGFSPNTFDLGAAVGAGLDVGPFFASVRYNIGLTNLDANSADWKSKGFYGLAGVRF